jgi:tetratricopeptide (TPR) repeat protein
VAAAVPWYRDGVAALHNGAYHRASKALARAVEIDPSYAMAHAYLAEAWYELDYLERAKDELLKAMPSRGSLPEADALHLDAIRLTVTGEFQGAAQVFEKMSARTGPDERGGALLDLGRAQERNQDTKKALAAYAEAVRLDPQNAAPGSGWDLCRHAPARARTAAVRSIAPRTCFRRPPAWKA